MREYLYLRKLNNKCTHVHTRVGRKAEMERFLIELQHMTEQTQRNPGAIIISGSGGIGKTKLLRAMKSKASSMGIR